MHFKLPTLLSDQRWRLAVYTQIDDEALATFLGKYELGNLLSFAGIAEGVENSITCCEPIKLTIS